ncbi:paraquat-inducible protein B [Sphingomonas trueperi]|uniref:hypothetical protein n=1 Tax=Sphingomonas trueperi TaxID=53317 RepID=UPI003392564A
MDIKGTQLARIHWATFDASESNPAYNLDNCSMAMELLNENVGRLNAGKHPVKFWCEKGKYHS